MINAKFAAAFLKLYASENPRSEYSATMKEIAELVTSLDEKLHNAERSIARNCEEERNIHPMFAEGFDFKYGEAYYS